MIIENAVITKPQTDPYHQCEYVYIYESDNERNLVVFQEDGDGEMQETTLTINYCPQCGKNLH